MASVSTVITLPLVPGQQIPCRIGTVGRGKQSQKVRLVPETNDPNVLLAVFKTFPKWELQLKKVVSSIFNAHSSAAISGLPTVLTEESLAASAKDGTLQFDQNVLNEGVESDLADERAGKVSAEAKLREWDANNRSELNTLMLQLTTATANGEVLDQDSLNRVTALIAEQNDLITLAAKEELDKEARKAKRANKTATTTTPAVAATA